MRPSRECILWHMRRTWEGATLPVWCEAFSALRVTAGTTGRGLPPNGCAALCMDWLYAACLSYQRDQVMAARPTRRIMLTQS